MSGWTTDIPDRTGWWWWKMHKSQPAVIVRVVGPIAWFAGEATGALLEKLKGHGMWMPVEEPGE